jgi:hypothetical protein
MPYLVNTVIITRPTTHTWELSVTVSEELLMAADTPLDVAFLVLQEIFKAYNTFRATNIDYENVWRPYDREDK